MQCNINPAHRLARLFLGFLLMFSGSILFVVNMPGDTMGWRIFQVVIMLFGIFMMFEGAMGWCAVKALMSRFKS